MQPFRYAIVSGSGPDGTHPKKWSLGAVFFGAERQFAAHPAPRILKGSNDATAPMDEWDELSRTAMTDELQWGFE